MPASVPSVAAVEQLLSAAGLRPASRVYVGYSGGLDSTVLLHLLSVSAYRRNLTAVHVDHGLQPDANAWARASQRFAASLNIPCDVLRVQVDDDSPDGLEAAARAARYQALGAVVGQGEGLALAHHQDDQAETLLLQLLRGGGSAGGAAMPLARGFGAGTLVRPLLAYPRAALSDYAEAHELPIITDPHNAEDRFDRVFIRRQVLPLLRARWPDVTDKLAASASQLGEDLGLVRSLAASDLAKVLDRRDRLQAGRLLRLSDDRARAAIREWVRRRSSVLPPKSRLNEFLRALRTASSGHLAELTWQQHALKHFRGRIYHCSTTTVMPAGEFPWRGTGLTLPAGFGRLERSVADQRWIVRFRQGGEVVPMARGQHKALKDVLRETGIVPWYRGAIPLIYDNDRLIAVAGLARLGPQFPQIRWVDGPQIR